MTRQLLQQQQTPLQEQVLQLQNERDNATGQLTALRQANERLSLNLPELLRLRGEVGALRRQVEQQKAASAKISTATDENPEPADALEQQKQMQLGKLIDGKNLAAQVHFFASDNQGWLPTNWPQALKYSDDFPVSGTNHFEFVHQQPINIHELGTDLGNTVIVREYMAWRAFDGKWRKIHRFADGHSQAVEVADGNFAAWESQNTYNPASATK